MIRFECPICESTSINKRHIETYVEARCNNCNHKWTEAAYKFVFGEEEVNVKDLIEVEYRNNE